MRCNIIWTDPATGNEILENVRHTDEIIEHEGMSDETAARFELEMKNPGRYHLGANRCVWPARVSDSGGPAKTGWANVPDPFRTDNFS